LPRVVKRKMSNFALKRDPHRHWPQPTKRPDLAVVIVTRTAREPEGFSFYPPLWSREARSESQVAGSFP
jgi:hypothetical protein